MNIYHTHDLTYVVLWPYDSYRRTVYIVDGVTLADSFEQLAMLVEYPRPPYGMGEDMHNPYNLRKHKSDLI